MNASKVSRKGFLSALRTQGGFTLVELIVVIAILGILAGVGAVGYNGYIRHANEKMDETLYYDIVYAGALGSYQDPDATGRVVVTTTGASAGGANPDVIEQWMASAFGADWESTVKYRTSAYASKHGTISLPQIKVDLTDDQELLVSKVQDSNFSGNEDQLLNMVDKLTDALAARTDALATLQMLDAEGYQSYMEYLESNGYVTNEGGTYKPVAGKDAELANASVLYLASVYGNGDGSYNAESARDALLTAMSVSGSDASSLSQQLAAFKTAGNDNGMAGAAMAYALTISYANSGLLSEEESQKIKDDAGKVTGVTSMLEYVKSVNTDGFKAYLASDAGTKDVDGYLSAMQLVNNFGDDVDITQEGVYGSDSTLALLQGILGR